MDISEQYTGEDTPPRTVLPDARSAEPFRDGRRRWFGLVTVGATAAWALPIIVYPLADALTPWSPAGAAVPAAALGATVLAVTQVRALRRWSVAVPPLDWALATAVAAALEWSIISAAIGYGARLAALPVLLQVLVVATGVPAMAFVLGICQWRVLRSWSDQAVLWIWADAVAWIMGVTVFLGVARPLYEGVAPVYPAAVVSVVFGVILRGAVFAAVTGLYLVLVFGPEHLHSWLAADETREQPEQHGAAAARDRLELRASSANDAREHPDSVRGRRSTRPGTAGTVDGGGTPSILGREAGREKEVAPMRAHVGDWLVIEHGAADGAVQRGLIEEIHGENGNPPYLVHWTETGRRALMFPGPDAHVVTAADLHASQHAAAEHYLFGSEPRHRTPSR
ncbi:DUF1918 domain-containing protein [Nocardia sp. NPDC003963]